MSPRREAVNRAVRCPVTAPPVTPPALASDAIVEAGARRALPAAFDASPPFVPEVPPPGDDPKFGTLAGAVCRALVNGTLTGPLPMTRAATAATALRDASPPTRQSSTRRGLAALEAATAATAPGTSATTAGDTGRPKSRDAKTSSKVA
ncbi:MAG TPA: hypothetical protein VG346_07980 [Acidimicrobiales bacterium]|nr:hypothetical protein [Acidimicrobiales bacterium]